MRNKLLITCVSLCLTACGGSGNESGNDNLQPPGSSPLTPPDNNRLPSSPQARPDISFNEAMIEDVEHFVTLAHSVQYFYPSEAVSVSDWPLFIAESIVELSQTEDAARADKGIELLRQIAPYVTTQQGHLPTLEQQTQVAAWQQNAPFSQVLYERGLRSGQYGSLSNQAYMPSNRYATLNYGQQTVYIPLYLPTQTQLTGDTFSRVGRWQLTENFAQPEICMATVSGMWAMIQHFWPYFHQIELNWTQSLKPLLNACTESDLTQRNTRIYTEFTKLNDNHLSIALPDPELLPFDYNMPFFFEMVEGKAIVTRTEQNNPSDIEVGDEIISIDGEPVQTYLQNLAAKSLYNQLHRVNRVARMHFYKTSATPVRYEIKKSDERVIQQTVTPLKREGSLKFDGLRYVPHSADVLAPLGDNIYRINVYNVEQQALGSLKSQLADAKAVVLDMRHYPTSWQGWQGVLSWFIQTDAVNNTLAQYWQGAPNQSDVQVQSLPQTIHVAQDALNIPAIALASRESQSQSEHALVFARAGGIKVLGEATSGINGEIFEADFFNFSDDLSRSSIFVFTSMLANRLNGEPLINAGVEIDIWVPRTIESVRQHQDNQLEEAVNYLKAQLE
ncbi:peptidase S41 [Pseudoalteromonas rubra]|uniref:Peptidase S41 n=1 Tax=Pseudoalteromonas rubra TaxID=43658 RepID=A0A5S3WUL9_9GAMM|nr:PDZ domain-containing protein [Pseudoalteromonas rubra]TMP32621.1 peptidase S41 [Pseudoalteromonas rubra]TMP34315.1 peptidase S41 [Pseudoalteromonas rubra]